MLAPLTESELLYEQIQGRSRDPPATVYMQLLYIHGGQLIALDQRRIK